ncbi:hypothetical protein ACNKHL_23745 [Shigella flexneri]
MRRCSLHFEDDAHTYTLKYEYLLGRDVWSAPVVKKAVATGRSICRRITGSTPGQVSVPAGNFWFNSPSASHRLSRADSKSAALSRR